MYKKFIIATFFLLVVNAQAVICEGKSKMKYPYDAPPEKKERIVKNCNLIELGMTKTQVVELMGEPDETSYTYDKVEWTKKIGESYVYVLRRDAPRNKPANVKNERLIKVLFDIKGSVKGTRTKRLPSCKQIKIKDDM